MTLRKTLVVLAASLGWLGGGCGTEEGGGAAPLGRSASPRPPLVGQTGSYGAALALDGIRLAVGSAYQDPPTIYLFMRHGAAWVEDGVLTAPDDGFGRFIAMNGNRLAVGLPWAGEDARGRVRVYQRHDEGWSLEHELAPPADAPACFGAAVAWRGGHLMVGAPYGADGGEVLEFAPSRDWKAVARITPSVRTPYDGFGSALAAHAGALAVAAALSEAQVVTVFEQARWGGSWREVERLTEPVAEPGSVYGLALAMRDGILVVGCGCLDGEAWVYRRARGRWVLDAMLDDPEGKPATQAAHAVAVAPGGHLIAVAAPYFADGAGHVMLFARAHGGWRLAGTLQAPAPTPGANLGHALAMDSGVVVVGAPGDAGVEGEVFTYSLAGP